MDEEQRRRLREADQAARTMFNVLPQGATNAITNAASSAVQSVTNAASNLRVGPLIRTGGPQPAERATPTVPTLPSGTPMVGFDAYPTRPQMPPRAPTPFPYGSALGPSIYTQTPTQTNLQTGMAIPAPTGFGAINPPAFPQAPESISRLGLMGGTLSSGQVGPLPLEQITPMVAGQRPIIESGPVAMTATGTLTPEQRGRQAIQTPYGTVYATPEQAANMNRPRTIDQQSSRSPAEQQAMIARMREIGRTEISPRVAELEKQRQQDLTRGYYSFRQGLEQDKFQRAMTQASEQQARGGSGREALRIAEQARYGAEIARRAGANVGTNVRTPMFSFERATMPSGEQFYRGSMGQYSPVIRASGSLGGVGPAPQSQQATTSSTLERNLGLSGFVNPALFGSFINQGALVSGVNRTTRRRRTTRTV